MKCALAFAFNAVGMAAAFASELGPVPDQETGVASELVFGLGDDLNDEFLGDKLSPRGNALIQCIGFVEVTGDAAGVRGVCRLHGLQRAVL